MIIDINFVSDPETSIYIDYVLIPIDIQPASNNFRYNLSGSFKPAVASRVSFLNACRRGHNLHRAFISIWPCCMAVVWTASQAVVDKAI